MTFASVETLIVVTHGATNLPEIHAVSKGFQGSFQHGLLWQLATGVEDQVALNAGLHVVVGHANLVAARLCGVLTVCGNVNVLQSIQNFLAEPGLEAKYNAIV